MVNPEVIAYVRQNMQAGVSPEQLRENLLSNGWSQVDVNDVFREVSSLSPLAPGAVPVSAFVQAESAPAYASFFRRVAGHLIDGMIVSFITGILWLIVSYIFERQILALITPYIDQMVSFISTPATQAGPGWANVKSFFMGIGIVVGLSLAVSTLVNILYRAVMESSVRQASFGKMFVGLQVTDLSNQRISFARALGRNTASLLSSAILCIGYLLPLFTEKKQTLHDKIAGTLVFDVKRYGGGRVFGTFVMVAILSVVFQQVITRIGPSSLTQEFKKVEQAVPAPRTNVVVPPPVIIDTSEDQSNPAAGTIPENTPLEEGVDGSGL